VLQVLLLKLQPLLELLQQVAEVSGCCARQ
jgi:hypothetical protein